MGSKNVPLQQQTSPVSCAGWICCGMYTLTAGYCRGSVDTADNYASLWLLAVTLGCNSCLWLQSVTPVSNSSLWLQPVTDSCLGQFLCAVLNCLLLMGLLLCDGIVLLWYYFCDGTPPILWRIYYSVIWLLFSVMGLLFWDRTHSVMWIILWLWWDLLQQWLIFW